MNRMRRSRLLSGIVVVMFLPVILTGCCEVCPGECGDICTPLFWVLPLYFICFDSCMSFFCPQCENPWSSFDCTENPNGCAPTLEQMQIAAIEFCNDHPQECQQAFDAWVESLDEE